MFKDAEADISLCVPPHTRTPFLYRKRRNKKMGVKSLNCLLLLLALTARDVYAEFECGSNGGIVSLFDTSKCRVHDINQVFGGKLDRCDGSDNDVRKGGNEFIASSCFCCFILHHHPTPPFPSVMSSCKACKLIRTLLL